ncbi:uncharacterized protein [Hyperolius riggenbachi]|uniref:uncharacterized protein n=1 Tax=Hyperolius riggenbachi TaxID=752182 RepID=UPI0035A3A08F
MFQKKGVVGIFSRDHSSCYSWLIDFLFESSLVSDVRPIYISNTTYGLINGIEQCNFAILYHTKNKGRVNVTDVTDSLYDQELKILSKTFGKDKVIVVIDDLEHTSDEEKKGILEQQPSIKDLALDLFLFSPNKAEKSSAYFDSHKMDESRNKLQQIKNIIRAHNRRRWMKTFGPVVAVFVFVFVLIILANVFGFFLWPRRRYFMRRLNTTISLNKEIQ